MRHPSSRTTVRTVVAISAGLAVAVGLALPAAAAPRPLSPGFLNVTAKPGTSSSSTFEERQAELVRTGPVAGYPGNRHSGSLRLAGGGGPGEWIERHETCSASGTDCEGGTVLIGQVDEATVTRRADGTVKIKGTVTFPYDEGQAPVPLDLTVTEPGADLSPATAANATTIEREREIAKDTLVYTRGQYARPGTVTGRIGVVTAGAGSTYTWSRTARTQGDVGRPLGPVVTPAQLEPFLPARTSTGAMVEDQTAGVYLQGSGRGSVPALTVGGQRLPFNAVQVDATVARFVTEGFRQDGESVNLDGRRCRAGQAFDDCTSVRVPGIELKNLKDRIADDGTVTITARAEFTDQSTGEVLGSLPFTIKGASGGKSAVFARQTGTRNRPAGGAVTENFQAGAGWENAADLRITIGRFALTPIAPGTLNISAGAYA